MGHQIAREINGIIFSVSEIQSYLVYKRWKDGLVIGLMLTIFFYHFILFVFNRLKVYLYLAISALLYTLIASFYNGTYFEILDIPTSTLSYGIINCSIFGIWFFMVLLTDIYLELKKYLPNWRKVLFAINITNLVLEIIDVIAQVALGDQFIESAIWPITFFSHTFFTVLAPLSLIVSGILALLKKQQNAKFFMIAFLLLFGGGILVVIDEFQPINIHYHADIPAVVAFLFLSFGLARQFKNLQNERSEAEKQKALSDQMHELQKKEAERLKEIDQFKTQLYTNITHEFRTPLTVISGIADQIVNQPEEKDLILRNSRELLDLVNQMLDLNKIDSGHLKPAWIQTDIISLIKYLSESYHQVAQRQNKQFNQQILEESVWLDTDPSMLERILNNLVHNAIKYTSAGGHINLRVCTDHTQNICQISIQDNGRGIAEDQLDKIFDRFYQVDHTTTRQGEGTGIGLALVKELTNMLGGQISVTSELNQGSKFTVSLPITQGAEIISWTPRHKQPALQVDNQPLLTENPRNGLSRILIVEDHADVRTYLKKLLREDYQLLESENGKSGLSLAYDTIPDLIISDIMMPQLDGIAFCQKVKNDPRTSHIPVILLTAKSTQDDRIQGLQKGADAYLTKPFDKRELFTRIEKLLESREKLRNHYQQFQMLPKEQVKENSFLEKIRQHVEDNFPNESYQIEDLATHLHLSRTQVYRKLKALTGNSFTDIVKQMKMHRAKELLSKTDKSVAEIAYELGFSDASYFSKVFKEIEGSSPTEYRT